MVNYQKQIEKKVKKKTNFYSENGKSKKKSHSKNRSPVNILDKKSDFFFDFFWGIFKKNQKYGGKKGIFPFSEKKVFFLNIFSLSSEISKKSKKY